MRRLSAFFIRWVKSPFKIIANPILTAYDFTLDFIGIESATGSSRVEDRHWKKVVKEMEFKDSVQYRNSDVDIEVYSAEFSRGQVVNHLAEMNRKAATAEHEPQDSSA